MGGRGWGCRCLPLDLFLKFAKTENKCKQAKLVFLFSDNLSLLHQQPITENMLSKEKRKLTAVASLCKFPSILKQAR